MYPAVMWLTTIKSMARFLIFRSTYPAALCPVIASTGMQAFMVGLPNDRVIFEPLPRLIVALFFLSVSSADSPWTDPPGFLNEGRYPVEDIQTVMLWWLFAISSVIQHSLVRIRRPVTSSANAISDTFFNDRIFASVLIWTSAGSSVSESIHITSYNMAWNSSQVTPQSLWDRIYQPPKLFYRGKRLSFTVCSNIARNRFQSLACSSYGMQTTRLGFRKARSSFIFSLSWFNLCTACFTVKSRPVPVC